ncbi:MAG: hypothetical protein PHF46_01540 [Candidatus Gracilibacteria bacterium]|nr:hypothetical protein [Candidatus Gracilibacteria bacterium]MDD3120075.1 hypothetical protein [Candidatus Gracilibacteria bacterium]
MALEKPYGSLEFSEDSFEVAIFEFILYLYNEKFGENYDFTTLEGNPRFANRVFDYILEIGIRTLMKKSNFSFYEIKNIDCYSNEENSKIRETINKFKDALNFWVCLDDKQRRTITEIKKQEQRNLLNEPKESDCANELRKRFNCKRKVDNWYEEISKILYGKENFTTNEIKEKMQPFSSAYEMAKQAFSKKKREALNANGEQERYFNHLLETMKIVLYELPNPNIDRIIIALLNDIKEDIPGITHKFLSNTYGEHVAKGIKELSKKDWKIYIDNIEMSSLNGMVFYFSEKYGDDFLEFLEESGDTSKLDEYEKGMFNVYLSFKEKGKQLRNEDYFGHMCLLDDDYLAVKLADRIHNLRTLEGTSLEKIIRKIEEAKKYFLIPEIQARNFVGYNLIFREVEYLEKKYCSANNIN